MSRSALRPLNAKPKLAKELPLFARMELKFQKQQEQDERLRDRLLVERHRRMLQRKCVTS